MIGAVPSGRLHLVFVSKLCRFVKEELSRLIPCVSSRGSVNFLRRYIPCLFSFESSSWSYCYCTFKRETKKVLLPSCTRPMCGMSFIAGPCTDLHSKVTSLALMVVLEKPLSAPANNGSMSPPEQCSNPHRISLYHRRPFFSKYSLEMYSCLFYASQACHEERLGLRKGED